MILARGCHPISDATLCQVAGQRDPVDLADHTRFSQDQRLKRSGRWRDGQLDDPSAARHISGTRHLQVDDHAHPSQECRQHVLEVMRRRREILEHSALDPGPDNRVRKARQREHLNASIVVEPAVPMFQSYVPPTIRGPGKK
jgi:hypothetical protein